MSKESRSEVNIDKLVRPHLVNIQTYASVDPPEILAERAGISPDEIVDSAPAKMSPKAAISLSVHGQPMLPSGLSLVSTTVPS